MQCPTCGAPVAQGSAFCENCGTDVRAVTQQAPPPAQPSQPYPQQYAPPAGPYPPQQPQPYPPQQYAAPGYQQPGYPPQGYAAQQQAPRKGAGAVVGIVLAIVLGLVVVGVGGYFVYTGMFAGAKKPSSPASPSAVATAPAAPAVPATPVTETAPAAPSDEIVTDSEAVAVVTAFMKARLAQDVVTSKTYCTKQFLSSSDGKTFVNDKFWHPDSYEITKLTPDLMYIHVTVMGDWPSGREPSIFSVFREPASGKVLIDGMLDPANFPELVTP
jgi:hypothetical protein